MGSAARKPSVRQSSVWRQAGDNQRFGDKQATIKLFSGGEICSSSLQFQSPGKLSRISSETKVGLD